MDNTLQKHAEMKALNYKKSFGSIEDAETKRGNKYAVQ